MDARHLLLRLGVASLIGDWIAIPLTGVANAEPASLPLLSAPTVSFNKAAWVQQCWWRQGLWGPQQVCQQVWVEPDYYNYDRGYRFDGGWGYHGPSDEEDEDDEE